MALTKVLVGAALLSPGKGGIARVARMTVQTISQRDSQLEVVSFLDTEPQTINAITAVPSCGQKLRFLCQVHLRALRATHAIYDSVGIARAHPRLPGLTRPYAVWIHGVEVWYALSADRRRALDQAALVLVNSKFTLDKFESIHGPLPSAQVCELATEGDDTVEFARPPVSAKTVLCVGRIDAGEFNKGHHALLNVWPEVVARHSEAKLVFVGGGDGLEAFRTLVQASPVAGRVEVRGFVPEEAMAGEWQQARVFALPSRKEGFGIVYAEAMRHGLPVVATVHDAGQEVNVDGVTGYNVNLDEAGELTARLIQLLNEPGQARAMGHAGFERWRTRYCYSAFEQRLDAILDTFLY